MHCRLCQTGRFPSKPHHDAMTIFTELHGDPLFLILLVIATCYVLEDAAMLLAASLASSGQLATSLCFFAAVVGLVSSDFLLYGVGRLSQRHAFLRQWIAKRPTVQRTIHMVRDAHWTSIVALRFIPLMRLPGYVACGLAHLPATYFLWLIFLSAALWAGLILALATGASTLAPDAIGSLHWILGAVAVLTLFWFNRYLLAKVINGRH